MNSKRNQKVRRPVRLDRRDGLAKVLDLDLIQEGLKVSLLLASVRRKAPRWEELGR